MSLTGDRTFVGFGLGAIQAGLFLYEAFTSDNFNRLVVAEVIPETVCWVRENRGYLTVNIAYADRIEPVCIGPVEILNPSTDVDRCKLIDALAAAHEIATAVPGIRYYASIGPESLCHILAAGLQIKLEHGGPPAVLYAAENHNRAAEILEELVLAEITPLERVYFRHRVCFSNTVIGKMSGSIVGRPEIEHLGISPMTPGSDRAFLVEAFNHIYISRISYLYESPHVLYKRGFTTFIEKEDLLPFEEAKLYGHNATHALAAYMGALLGIWRIADIPTVPGLLGFLRRAFIEESGKALIHRYEGIDPLFTPQGYADYADNLLMRMVNPWLADTVERVGRDVERKLGWNDRLVGTLRVGISEGVEPRRYALGTAAALIFLDPEYLTQPIDPEKCLLALWGDTLRDPVQERAVLALVRDALEQLRGWHAENSKSPQELLGCL